MNAFNRRCIFTIVMTIDRESPLTSDLVDKLVEGGCAGFKKYPLVGEIEGHSSSAGAAESMPEEMRVPLRK